MRYSNTPHTSPSFFTDRSGRIHMNAVPVTGMAPNALENLISYSCNELTLLVTKTNGIVKLWLLPDEHSPATLEAERIRLDESQKATLVLNPAVSISRSLERGLPLLNASRPVRTPMVIRPMTQDFSASTLNVSLDDEHEYLLVHFIPIQARPWVRLSEECNAYFLSNQTYTAQIIASSNRVAEAACRDFSKSGCTFAPMEDMRDYTPGALHHIDSNTMIGPEAQLLCRALTGLVQQSIAPSATLEAPSVISEGLVNAELKIGTVNGVPVGIPISKLVNNTAVLGINGCGKSYLLGRRFIRPLHQRDIPVLVIAPIKDDFSQLFPDADIYRAGDPEHPFSINLLDLPDDCSAPRIATRTLSTLVNMGGPESVIPTILANVCQTLYASDLTDVDLSTLTSMIKRELASSSYAEETKKGLLQACLTRLKSLYLEPCFSCSESKLIIEQAFGKGKLTIVELEQLEPNFRRATATVLLEKIIRHARSMGTSHDIQLIVVIDELHCLFNEEAPHDDIFKSTLADAVNTLRGNGVGLILTDQRILLMGHIAEDGCANHVIMRSRPTDQAAELLCLEHDDIKHLPYLQTGDCMLHVSGERTAALERITDAHDGPQQSAAPKAPEERNWCPYGVCKSTCTACDSNLRKIAVSAVTKALGDGKSYPTYRADVLRARKLPAPERTPAYSAAYQHLEDSVKDTAMEKYKHAGMDLADMAKIAILRHCLSQELRRQIRFKAD